MEKKSKSKLKEKLLDIVLEILFGLVCVAIGIGVLSLFGKKIEAIDFEIAALIGAGIIIAIFIALYLVIHSSKGKDSEKEDKQE